MTEQPRDIVASAAVAASPAPLVRANGVTLQYKTPEHLVTATYRVSFDIFPGERYVILGPSGCGKSTILKAIAGFLKPAEGEILLKGKSIREPGPDRLMVFQEFDQLLPWKTVLGNVMFPMRENKIGSAEATCFIFSNVFYIITGEISRLMDARIKTPDLDLVSIIRVHNSLNFTIEIFQLFQIILAGQSVEVIFVLSRQK